LRINPNDIYEKLVTAGDLWADCDAAASILEESKKSLLSQLSTDIEGSQAAKESFALRHPEYKAHLEQMVDARKEANKAKVRYESAKMFSELMRTVAANERATMGRSV